MPLPNFGWPGSHPRDRFGGYADMPFTGTYLKGSPGFFRTGIQGSRVVIVDPDGNIFPYVGLWPGTKFGSPSHRSEDGNTGSFPNWNGTSGQTYATQKYGDVNAKWSQSWLAKAKSMGFTVTVATELYGSKWLAPYTYLGGTSFWSQNDPRPAGGTTDWQVGGASVVRTRGFSPTPQPTPMVGTWAFNYAREGSNNSFGILDSPFKNCYQTSPAIQPTAFIPDVFDPRFQQYYSTLLPLQVKDATGGESRETKWMLGIMMDDTDGMDGMGGGPLDQGFSTTFIQGHGPHIAYFSAISRPWVPTGQSATGANQTYVDPRHFTKLAWRDYLVSKYGTISSLNAAWGTGGFYTTFDEQDASGHTTWGAGTGVMDEDGRHSWFGTYPSNVNKILHGTYQDINPNLLADLNTFLRMWGERYFSTVHAVVKTALPNTLYMGVMSFGTWGAPPFKELLQAAGPYIDVMSGQIMFAGASDAAERVRFCAEHLGQALPIVSWEGWPANPDSVMAGFNEGNSLPTQTARGTLYQNTINQILTAQNPNDGLYYCQGPAWWEMYDNWAEELNWGLQTPRQNLYDGVAARIAPPATESVTIEDGLGTARTFTYTNIPETANYGDFITQLRSVNAEFIHDTYLAQIGGTPQEGITVNLNVSITNANIDQPVNYTGVRVRFQKSIDSGANWTDIQSSVRPLGTITDSATDTIQPGQVTQFRVGAALTDGTVFGTEIFSNVAQAAIFSILTPQTLTLTLG